MESTRAKFTVGQLVHHKRFDYRGVIVDVDAVFQGTEEWYAAVALSRPPKDRPWYHVLVDGSDARTYVAERNLEPDPEGRPISHPELTNYFSSLTESGYQTRQKGN